MFSQQGGRDSKKNMYDIVVVILVVIGELEDDWLRAVGWDEKSTWIQAFLSASWSDILEGQYVRIIYIRTHMNQRTINIPADKVIVWYSNLS